MIIAISDKRVPNDRRALSTCRCTMRKLGNYRDSLQAAACLSHSISMILDDEDVNIDDPDDEDDTSDFYYTLALYLSLLAQPATGIGSRGPYISFPKSQDYFESSLQWPDRWFRDSYRCVPLCFMLFHCGTR